MLSQAPAIVNVTNPMASIKPTTTVATAPSDSLLFAPVDRIGDMLASPNVTSIVSPST